MMVVSGPNMSRLTSIARRHVVKLAESASGHIVEHISYRRRPSRWRVSMAFVFLISQAPVRSNRSQVHVEQKVGT
jgi:hypothetical protein